MLDNPQETLKNIAINSDENAFDSLQTLINELDDKVSKDSLLDDKECQFLVELFKSPWWGGIEYGFNNAVEASEAQQTISPDNSDLPTSRNTKDQKHLANVQLARHYINGSGQPYAANLQWYRTSAIVKDTINALKKHICELIGNQVPANVVRSSDSDFLHSNHAEEVMKARQNFNDLGFIFNDGTMALDQADPWITNHNHRFLIHASTSKINEHLVTRWRIEGQFGFDIQGIENSFSELPLNKEQRLKITNRLSHQLAKQGHANKFMYFADWSERYMLFPIKTRSASPFSGINM